MYAIFATQLVLMLTLAAFGIVCAVGAWRAPDAVVAAAWLGLHLLSIMAFFALTAKLRLLMERVVS